MTPVSINYDTCKTCFLCTQTSARCFSKADGKVMVESTMDTCVLCGKCVAYCPSGSIAHNVMNMANFPEVSKRKLVDVDDFVQFIRERRSHRAFTKKQIPKQDLEKLIDAVRYAPTGHNDQTVEIVLVQNPERRKKLSDLAVDFMGIVGQETARKLEELKKSGTAGPAELQQIEGRVQFMRMLTQARAEGRDPLFYEAPAVAIFHSTTQSVTPKDNCVIASTTMGLLARTLGLETTYIALFENAANAHKPLQKELNLPEGHKVFSVLVIGYPKVKYLRAVDRKPIKTRWV